MNALHRLRRAAQTIRLSGIITTTRSGRLRTAPAGSRRALALLAMAGVNLPLISDSQKVPTSWFNSVRTGHIGGKFVNVRALSNGTGAKGTGSTGADAADDTAAFNAAVVEAGPGGTIYIPETDADKFYWLPNGWTIDGYPGIKVIGGGAHAVLGVTGAGQDCVRVYNSPGAYIGSLALQSAKGAQHGLVVGKADNTGPSHRVTIENMVIPPNFDGNGIQVNHGIITRIINPLMTGNQANPSTHAALNGGNQGSNGSNRAINIANQPFGQNNAPAILAPLIEGWGRNGIYIDTVEVFSIHGGTIEGNMTKEAGGSTDANVYLRNCTSGIWDGIYCEPTGSLSVRDLIVDGGSHCTFRGRVGGTATNIGGVDIRGQGLRHRFENVRGGFWLIGASCEDTTLIDCIYGSVTGASFTDNGKRTRVFNLINASNQGFQHGGRWPQSPQNLSSNGLFGRWKTNGLPDEFDALSANITRTGLGQADAEKDQGIYAMKIVPVAGQANAGVIWDPTRGGANLPYSRLVGQRLTVKVRCKKTAGTTSPAVALWYDGGAAVRSQGLSEADATWRTFYVTFTIESGFAGMRIQLMSNAGTIDDAMVTYWDAFEVYVGELAPSGSEFTGALHQDQHVQDGHSIAIASGATLNIYHQAAAFQAFTLTANITAVNLNNPIIGRPLWLKFTQGGGGGFTVAGWPASVKWAGGAAPVITAAAGKSDMVGLLWDGTNWHEIALRQNL